MKPFSIVELLKLDPNLQQQILVIELSVRLGAIKSLLVKKGIITDDEIEKEMEDVTTNVMEMFKNDPAFDAIKSITENMAEVAAENLIHDEKSTPQTEPQTEPVVEPGKSTVENPATKRKLDPRLN